MCLLTCVSVNFVDHGSERDSFPSEACMAYLLDVTDERVAASSPQWNIPAHIAQNVLPWTDSVTTGGRTVICILIGFQLVQAFSNTNHPFSLGSK